MFLSFFSGPAITPRLARSMGWTATKGGKMKPSIVIHVFSGLAGGVGAGLAQLPGSDAPVLVALQTSMIMVLAEMKGISLTRAAAAELVLTLSATMAGRGVSQVLLGWVPAWGNALNAATAASVTEAVGWAAWKFFEKEAAS